MEALGLLVCRLQTPFVGAGAAGGNHAKARVTGLCSHPKRFFAWAGRVLLGSFSRSKNSFQPVFPLFFLDGSCEFDPSSVGCHSTCVDEKCLRACLEIKHGNGKIFIENN